MRARSALFDVYGDHLRSRGDQAPVSSLIRLLEPVGIAAPAVRTAISRMSAQGWLEPTRVDAAPGYRATRRAIERLTEAASRIYRRGPEAWDGRWRLVFVDLPRERGPGSGCGRSCTTSGTPSTPRPSGCARSTGPRSTRWSPAPAGAPGTPSRSSSPPTRVGAWDLAALATSYAAWPDLADALVARRPAAAPADEDEAAFAARFRLVHEWRKFLFDDPGLPAELLPRDWPGQAAADLFTSEAARLKPASDRFVARCLGM